LYADVARAFGDRDDGGMSEVDEARVAEPIGRGRVGFGRVVTESVYLSALAAGLGAGGVGAGLVYLISQVLGNYGFAVFVVEPVAVGYAAAALHSWHRHRGLKQCLAVAMLAAVGLPSVALLFLGIEGLVCVAMAMVIWGPLALLGGVAGWWLQRRPREESPAFPVILKVGLALALIPMTFGFERVATPEPEIRQVTTVVEINAPPAVVWRHVVAMPPLPPARPWVFRAGLACPVGTRVVGSGVGASRYCDLTTGTMPERVTGWEEGKRLAFEVLETPPSMREVSFYGEVKARHLEGYFTVVRGEMRLEGLPGGRTRVVGTSWYRTRIAPVAYWDLWCRYVVHAVHRRVFEHVKGLSEADGQTPVG
jgi:hypothetical protein